MHNFPGHNGVAATTHDTPDPIRAHEVGGRAPTFADVMHIEDVIWTPRRVTAQTSAIEKKHSSIFARGDNERRRIRNY